MDEAAILEEFIQLTASEDLKRVNEGNVLNLPGMVSDATIVAAAGPQDLQEVFHFWKNLVL